MSCTVVISDEHSRQSLQFARAIDDLADHLQACPNEGLSRRFVCECA